LRSKHAIYTYNLNHFPVFYLYLTPITKDQLNNFIIEYENGVKISTDLLLMKNETDNLKLNSFKKINIFNSSYDIKFENARKIEKK
jgi:hypothetical protein